MKVSKFLPSREGYAHGKKNQTNQMSQKVEENAMNIWENHRFRTYKISPFREGNVHCVKM